MMHPLLRTLASQPELLAEHALGYAQLASAEFSQAAQQWRRRTLLVVGVVVGSLLTLVLGGGALLVLAAVPTASMPAPWALAAVPALPLLLAAGCAVALRISRHHSNFALLRHQLELDGLLLRQAADG